MSSTVYVVHCIDTEGPLFESLDATFERLREAFGLVMEPDRALLRQLQNGEIDLGGKEEAVQMMLHPNTLAYLETWDAIDAVLEDAMSEDFRKDLLDSEGNGWIYNWFCVDHIGYDLNPRRRDIGYHNIFDHYEALIRQTGSLQDGLHFHYHPHAYLNHAHRSGTHWWAFSGSLSQVISRRIIDRHWFPTVNRPGFHVNRPDSHWFMEQYIPFDYSNQSIESTLQDRQQRNVMDGRYGDWRRAPNSWTPYHPSHDDYQQKGSCRRWIARCLNIGSRHRLLNKHEVERAFMAAKDGEPTILAFTNHDFRDIRPDVNQVRELLRDVSSSYPEVDFVFCEATEAIRRAMDLPVTEPCELDVRVHHVSDRIHTLEVTSETPTFGPQPWLAIKTVTGNYFSDNFDIQQPFHAWSYTFDQETLPITAIEKVGVASNNAYGAATVACYDFNSGKASHRTLNTNQLVLHAS